MTVIVRSSLHRTPSSRSQLGMALLQVLIISSVISALAIRFSKTARDQVEIVSQIDGRIRSQLLVHSAINEVVFLHLSTSIESRSGYTVATDIKLPEKDRLNVHGASFKWRAGVIVKLQDLNGLLPQMYPNHFLWRAVLRRQGLSKDAIDEYLGIWGDAQDSDSQNWVPGSVEPSRMPSGHPYLNGFAQDSKVLEAVFYDQTDIVDKLLPVSDIDGLFDVNLRNAPFSLLQLLLGSEGAIQIDALRRDNNLSVAALRSALPVNFDLQSLSFTNSNLLKISATASLNNASWSQTQNVLLRASKKPPFNAILRE